MGALEQRNPLFSEGNSDGNAGIYLVLCSVDKVPDKFVNGF